MDTWKASSGLTAPRAASTLSLLHSLLPREYTGVLRSPPRNCLRVGLDSGGFVSNPKVSGTTCIVLLVSVPHFSRTGLFSLSNHASVGVFPRITYLLSDRSCPRVPVIPGAVDALPLQPGGRAFDGLAAGRSLGRWKL